MQQPYQFAFHSNVSKTAQGCYAWDTVTDAIKHSRKLTRAAKDRIFHTLQGNTGKHNYRVMGWVYPIGQFMKTYLVNYEHYGWQEIKAFDKTNIRFSYYTNRGILEIIEKPTK